MGEPVPWALMLVLVLVGGRRTLAVHQPVFKQCSSADDRLVKRPVVLETWLRISDSCKLHSTAAA